MAWMQSETHGLWESSTNNYLGMVSFSRPRWFTEQLGRLATRDISSASSVTPAHGWHCWAAGGPGPESRDRSMHTKARRRP